MLAMHTKPSKWIAIGPIKQPCKLAQSHWNTSHVYLDQSLGSWSFKQILVPKNAQTIHVEDICSHQ